MTSIGLDMKSTVKKIWQKMCRTLYIFILYIFIYMHVYSCLFYSAHLCVLLFPPVNHWPPIVDGLVESVKSQILSHWSLTASGDMGSFFLRTMSPWERSQRTAHIWTHTKKKKKKPLNNEKWKHTSQWPTGRWMSCITSQMHSDVLDGTKHKVLTFTNPACTNLEAESHKQTQTVKWCCLFVH